MPCASHEDYRTIVGSDVKYYHDDDEDEDDKDYIDKPVNQVVLSNWIKK